MAYDNVPSPFQQKVDERTSIAPDAWDPPPAAPDIKRMCFD
jgi:hypothetical protein